MNGSTNLLAGACWYLCKSALLTWWENCSGDVGVTAVRFYADKGLRYFYGAADPTTLVENKF